MLLFLKFFKKVAMLVIGLLLSSELFASQTYWFSDIPPSKEFGRKLSSSHGGPVLKSRRNGTSKLFWLRQGEDPVTSTYVKKSHAPLILLDAKKNLKSVTFKNRSYAEAVFKMPDEGFYNLFMVNSFVEKNILHSIIAKKETLNHSCREGHDDIKEKMIPNSYDAAPIDIIRERMPKERFHTHVTSGDHVSYLILKSGKPLQDASVTLVTQKGWKKTLNTDNEGRVTYEMIRDYYPVWHEFKKRTRENFLVIVEHTETQAGTLDGKSYDTIKYKATASGSYYPSTKDYQSYLYGLLIGLFGFFVTLLAVYFHRKKRVNVYQEHQLD